jgi:hypothetical protein
MVFFGIGAGAVAGAILCDDLTAYFRNRQLLNGAQEALAQLRSLNSEYDVLLELLDADPNLFERLAPAALGIERQEPNTVYPSATLEQLAIARRALSGYGSALRRDESSAEGSVLAEQSRTHPENSKFPQEATPAWLTRCSEPRRRLVLFFVGAGLILTSFICFGSTADKHIGAGSPPGTPPKRLCPSREGGSGVP